MTKEDPQRITGQAYPLPAGPCGCGHIEGVHMVGDTRQRKACGANVATRPGASLRCPCLQYKAAGGAR